VKSSPWLTATNTPMPAGCLMLPITGLLLICFVVLMFFSFSFLDLRISFRGRLYRCADNRGRV
jgi:hypothetical protein